MPRYYFDFDVAVLERDLEGQDLRDDHAAILHGRGLAAMVAAGLDRSELPLVKWSVIVRQKARLLVELPCGRHAPPA